MEIPSTPEDFIGKEPTLEELKNYVFEKITLFAHINTDIFESNLNGNYYYLNNTNIHKDTMLTYSYLKNIYITNVKKNTEEFKKLFEILKLYYDYKIIELYRHPDKRKKNDRGGEMYGILKSISIDKKKIVSNQSNELHYY